MLVAAMAAPPKMAAFIEGKMLMGL